MRTPYLTRGSSLRKNRSIGSRCVRFDLIELRKTLTMTRKPGNAGWSSGRPVAIPASSPTEFELEAHRLGLSEEEYTSSDRLRHWCAQNRERCYVPEWLLKRWGMTTDPNVA